MKFKRFIPAIVILFFSTALIFFQFNQVPKNLSFDEVEFAKLALSLDDKPYTPYSAAATGHSTLYFYIILFSFKVFGVNNFALRFPSAIFGVLSAVLFFQIMKLVFKKPAVYYLATVIFISSRWFFNFARFSFEATFLLFLELASIYFLFKSWNKPLKDKTQISLRENFNPNIIFEKTVSSFDLLLSGLFAGLAFNSYTPGRIFFLLPLALLALKKRFSSSAVKQLLIFLIPFLVAAAPLAFYLVSHQDTRVDRLFFWKNQQMTLSEKVSGTLQNIASISGMFSLKGDLNGRHNYPGKPALNPLLGLLFIAGLILAVKQFKNVYNKFFLFYFFLSLFPSLMIYPWENPNMLRTFTAIPSVVYFVGVALAAIIKKFRHKYTVPIIIALIVLSSVYEIRTYFKYQKGVFNKAFEIKQPLNKIIK